MPGTISKPTAASQLSAAPTRTAPLRASRHLGPLAAPGQLLASPETRLRYRVERLIGEGGFGQVYLARRIGRSSLVPARLCVKLSPRIDGWLREAYFGQLLERHPRAIRVYDAFPLVAEDGRVLYCLALEHARHGDLRAHLHRSQRGWPEAKARREIAGVLEVLGKLHRGQLLHRDLTPLNVFVCEGPTLKLGDFGLVRHQSDRRGASASTLNPINAPSDVLAGGVPKWQARDDVYQVGQLLGMLVKGNARVRIRTEEIRALPCSDHLKEIVHRCIGERRKRYETADELIGALRNPPAALRAGALRSLKGVHLAFTGFLSRPRREAAAAARRAGAVVHGAPSRLTTVVVRGRPNPLQAAGRDAGLKLMEIKRLRDRVTGSRSWTRSASGASPPGAERWIVRLSRRFPWSGTMASPPTRGRRSAMDPAIALTPNRLVRALGKPASEFTRRDIVSFIEGNDIRMLNFRFVAGDGRLKKVNFVINGKAHLDRVLSMGERVDGSSLFPFVSADSSDLYVVPRYRTAFVNPFADVPTLDLICSFYDNLGQPLASAPEQIVRKAQALLTQRTGLTLEALGELEYYVMSEVDRIYPIVEQKGYHESHPFSKWGLVRREAMKHISEMGGQIKYGHAEVGNILQGNLEMVQQEIEFLPVPIDEAADQLSTAKWVLREVAYKHGLEVSFAPKITIGHAGSGLHVHTRLMQDGRNVMADQNGLTDTARKLIAGLLMSARSLTALGNTVPTSFLRLVPDQEAPTSVCWGERNRSALVRVPLGWTGVGDRMIRDANPLEGPGDPAAFESNQTVELRSPDGSAHVHLLLAGMAVAARYGLEHPDALRVARELYVQPGVADASRWQRLPASCHEAAECLKRDRARYEEGGVFPAGLIDSIAATLEAYDDEHLSAGLAGDADRLTALVQRHLHCG